MSMPLAVGCGDGEFCVSPISRNVKKCYVTDEDRKLNCPETTSTLQRVLPTLDTECPCLWGLLLFFGSKCDTFRDFATFFGLPAVCNGG